MTTLVVGASGATGRLLVRELLDRGEGVRVVVRSRERLPLELDRPGLEVTEASLLDLSSEELMDQVAGCRAVASCLGHNLTLKGLFGSPRRLVTEATRRLTAAIRASNPSAPVRYVLMNTAGNRNRDLPERVSLAQRCVIGLLRVLVPPHADNEQAADFLRTQIGQSDSAVEWVVVRPDTLLNQDHVTPYATHASPTRSAIFNAGQTSRINVAHFMAELIVQNDTWHDWRGQLPVIYNQTST